MKKSILNRLIGTGTILALVMGISLSAFSKNEEVTETNSFYTQGLDVVQLMAEMTQTEAYVDMFTSDSEIKTVIQEIGSGDYSVPQAVYAISVAEETLAAMTELEKLEDSSEKLKSFLVQRMFSSLMTQINAMGGVERLAASSICTVGKTFVDENATENVIYLYTYENANPVAVTFTVGDDHAVSANGVFVMYEDFTCGSVDEIQSVFSEIAVEVTEVPMEE